MRNNLHLDPIRIVHLSDLHFSQAKKKQKDVWKAVAAYINEDVRPDAILITGDVTDNATDEEFQLAKESLDALRVNHGQPGQPQYRIIPGNHDRYAFRGNSWTKHFFRKPYDFKANLFETYFTGYYPKFDAVADLKLGAHNHCWQVRIIGIDSNDPDCWFAQGAVAETIAVSAAECALSDHLSDLVIVLVHHHLLPIPAVERAAVSRHGLRNVANFTGLLNSGTLLSHLSEAQVNLVLHGHEHERHLARFSGSGPYAGTTVVLAAGSGTGEKTGEGWSLNRVHFNLLELEPTRTVFLREVSLQAAGFSRGPRQLLLTGAAIRQSRFVRRNRRQSKLDDRSLPTSRIKKLFLLEVDRSATVVESRTDIAAKPEWSLTTKSPSGYLDDDAEVEFEWPSGQTVRRYVPFVAAESGDHEAFSCGLLLPNVSDAVLLKCLTVRWRWVGAVLLRRSDANLLPPAALTGLRADSREFVALRIRAEEEFEQGSITLGMPPGHSPPAASFRVHWEDLKEPGKLQYSEELTLALEFCGLGHVELRIPFPIPDYCYYLSWELCSDGDEYEKSRKLMTNIHSNAEYFRKQVLNEICGGLQPDSIRVTLYGHVKENTPQLIRLTDDIGAPHCLDLHDPRSRARSAFFGEAKVISRDVDVNNDLLSDESFLLFIPVPIPFDDLGYNSALLRVAAKEGSGLNWTNDLPIPPSNVLDFIEKVDAAAIRIARLA